MLKKSSNKIVAGMDIFDLCIKEYGNLDNILVLLVDNNLNLNSYLSSGQEILIDSDNITDIKVSNEYKRLSYFPVNTNEEDLTTVMGDFNGDFNNDYDI